MSNKIHHLQDVNNEMLAYYFNDLKSDTTIFFFGGYSSPANPSNSTPHIHYINFHTKGNSIEFGELSVASGGCGGHCDTHGGFQ